MNLPSQLLESRQSSSTEDQFWENLPIPDDPGSASVIIRLNALGSLYFFASFVLRRERLVEHLHLPIASSLEKRNVNYLLEMPRDHFKSTLATEALPIWWALPFDERDEVMMRELGYGDAWIAWMKWAHNPQVRTLLISEAGHNTIKLGMRIDQHFYNNGRFIDTFPEIIPDEKSVWNSESKHVKHTGFHAHGEGTFDCIGVGGALQSRHYDRMIEDDLVGREALKSEIVMNDTIEYHKLLEGAFDGPDRTELVVGNRWSPWDLNGWIRENEPEFLVESHSALGGCCDLHPPGRPIFPEEFTIERLERIRRRQGPYLFCLPDEAPILMSDWTEKPIVDVQIGDEIVGFSLDGYNRLVKSKVLAKCEQTLPIVRVTLDSGRQLLCTENHKWLIGNSGYRKKIKHPYLPARLGKKMVSVLNVSSPQSVEEQRDLDWLGGLIDGEGSANGATFISQSPEVNPEVCVEMQQACARLGFILKGTHPHNSWYIQGGRNTKVRLIRYARMAKKQRFIDYMWKRPARIAEDEGEQKVVKIEPAGIARVWGMETTSGNYVAYGFASANSHQYLNQELMPEEIVFKPEWLRFYAPTKAPTQIQGAPIKHWLRHEPHTNETGAVVPKDLNPRTLTRAMIVDPNHAEELGRARHSIVVVGLDNESDKVYLLDLWAQSRSFDELMGNIWRMCDLWGLTEFWLETVAFQRFLKYHVEYRNKVETRKLKVRDLKTQRSKNSKWDRIDSLAPLFEQGKFYARHDQSAFLDEYYRYSHSTKHTVDILDCLGYMSQALEPMHARDLLEKQRERKTRIQSRKGAY